MNEKVIVIDKRIINKLQGIISEIEGFRFCGPSDDPDEQTAVVYGFSHLLTKFKYYGVRLDSGFLKKQVEMLNIDLNNIYDVYDAKAEISPIMEEIKDYLTNPSYEHSFINDDYISKELIEDLGKLNNKEFGMKKLVQLCNEINWNYRLENYISVALLIRVLINYVPPIFGQATFVQVVSNSKRSVQELLSPLENNLRKVADLHTHNMIGRKDQLPTKNQLEPFRANTEILLQEILSRLKV
ncbi:hypothetical protein [Paenibacillus sp. P32E]|uniref:hypothetical protein n=1 Tax=Paenibacillus sp. P32E TaxID=1349434 RepID=UPI00093B30EE|nr:hypothetical protein [Paenibacillus sp. P32E]OKP91350.1 hypothetical protein A3848_09590 [Paenibacillus sp. P32E]